MGVDILARAMASGKGSGTSTLAVKVDHDTDEISLTKSGEPIADSGATLPKYGLSYDTATGGLTLTKDGQGIHGETVDLPPYGSPLKADTMAQMTDTDKVYVLTTDGHWYYYNGTAWTDGGVYNAVSVVTDKTLTVADTPADAKATGDELYDLKTQLNNETNARILLAGRVTTAEGDIDTLETHKVAQPLDEYNQPTDGTDGQLLRTKGDGTTEWADVGLPTDEQTAQAVSDWLDAHPEATTTVADGSLTEAKFTSGLKLKSIKDYITPQMYGAAGDGVSDDTTSLKNAIVGASTERKPVLITKDTILKITETITISGGTILVIDGRINAYNCDAIKVVGTRSKIAGNGTINGDGNHNGVVFGGVNKLTNVNYNIIEGVKIDNFDTGINIYNDQSDNLTVYFNIITNLNINNCRIGIGFYGYADAILVSKIVFTNCGSSDITGGAFVFKNIGEQFPLDNTIQQIFHHYSPNAITLNIEKVQYSQFAGIVCEQGGNSAKSIVITDTGTLANQFYITTNTAAFRTIPDSCMKNNVFVDVNGLSAGAATVYGDFSVKGLLTHGGTGENGKLFIKKQYKKTGIAENTTVELFTINKVATDCPRIFKVKVLIGTSVQATTLRKYSEAIIYYSGVTTTDVKVIQNLGNTSTPAISITTDGIVSAFSGDNGTETSTGFMLMEIEQIKDNSALSSNLNCTIGEGFVEM